MATLQQLSNEAGFANQTGRSNVNTNAPAQSKYAKSIGKLQAAASGDSTAAAISQYTAEGAGAVASARRTLKGVRTAGRGLKALGRNVSSIGRTEEPVAAAEDTGTLQPSSTSSIASTEDAAYSSRPPARGLSSKYGTRATRAEPVEQPATTTAAANEDDVDALHTRGQVVEARSGPIPEPVAHSDELHGGASTDTTLAPEAAEEVGSDATLGSTATEASETADVGTASAATETADVGTTASAAGEGTEAASLGATAATEAETGAELALVPGVGDVLAGGLEGVAAVTGLVAAGYSAYETHEADKAKKASATLKPPESSISNIVQGQRTTIAGKMVY